MSVAGIYYLRRFFAVFFLQLLVGCACNIKQQAEKPPYVVSYENQPVSTVVSSDNYSDPLEKINRAVFKFNDFSYRYALTPLSRGYNKVTPDAIEKSIDNVFLNLKEPVYAVNFLLQGKMCSCGKALARFTVNTTVGLAGLFDPADNWLDLERQPMRFGDTLAFYGVGQGPYLVLPLLGPSDLRSTSSLFVGYHLNLLNGVEHDKTRRELKVFDGFREQRQVLAKYPQTVDALEDPYTFLRNMFLQAEARDQAAESDEQKLPPKDSENQGVE